jgi:hypothetical protein
MNRIGGDSHTHRRISWAADAGGVVLVVVLQLLLSLLGAGVGLGTVNTNPAARRWPARAASSPPGSPALRSASTSMAVQRRYLISQRTATTRRISQTP